MSRWCPGLMVGVVTASGLEGAHASPLVAWQAVFWVVMGIAVAGLFAGAETGLISMNRVKLKYLVEAGAPSAHVLTKLLDQIDRFLGMTLVGTNLAVIAATVVFTQLCLQVFGSRGEWLAVLILTPLLLVFAEIIPKAWFRQRSDTVMHVLAHMLLVLCWIFSPAVRVTGWVADRLLSPFGRGQTSTQSVFVSKEELKFLISESERSGVLDPHERAFIYRIFEFGGTRVREVMTPRSRVESLHLSASIGDVLSAVRRTGLSRILVRSDRTGRWVGFIPVLDVLFEEQHERPLRALVRDVMQCADSMEIDRLLMAMRRRRQQIVVVVDAEGEQIGIATLDDLLEELTGEMPSREWRRGRWPRSGHPPSVDEGSAA